MKIAYEAPIPHLERLRPYCNTDYVLAHLYIDQLEYRNYFRRHLGDRFRVLDCSSYECGAPTTISDLLSIADEVQPDVITAPDYLNDEPPTVEAALELLQRSSWLVEGIVQGRDYEQRLHCMESLVSIGVQYIGLPLPVSSEPLAQRVVERHCLLAVYHQLGFRTPIHILSLASLLDGQMIASDKEVAIIDTSLPILLAQHGRFLRPYELVDRHSDWRLDFFEEMTEMQLLCSERNCESLTGIVGGLSE